MATQDTIPPAGAPSHVHPNDRTDARTQDAAQGPEFDELQHQLLGVLQHLRLVDQRLYDFQTVPPTLQAAGVVLHDATAALDGLYDALDAWHIRHVRAPDPALTEEEMRARTAVIVGNSKEHLARLLDNRRDTLYSVGAILGHAAEALDTHADPITGSISQNDACDVKCSLRGAQKLLNAAAEALEWPVIAEDAAALARSEETEEQT